MNNQLQGQVPRWKTALNMIINPGEVLKNQMTMVPWPYSLLISGLSFTLFFLQTGCDMFRSGQIEITTVILVTMMGLLYGTAGIAIIAAFSWALSQASKRSYSITWAISSFGLGYSASLIYSVTGLIFSLTLGWNTSVAFGVTGVLWALRPALFTIRQMSGEKIGFSIVLTTLCGAVLLMGWAVIGKLVA